MYRVTTYTRTEVFTYDFTGVKHALRTFAHASRLTSLYVRVTLKRIPA
jgi:hypothetical protein